ncbi:MAG TPA: hypothetical protein VIH92_09670 [Solirubrobacteraceae bacterium]
MNGTRYKLVGFVVWQGGKWYLRKRVRSARKLAIGGVAVASTLTAAALAAKRLAG